MGADRQRKEWLTILCVELFLVYKLKAKRTELKHKNHEFI